MNEGVKNSYGVDESDGVNWSNGVNLSNGVNNSDGVNLSDGVNRSNGVNGSDGVNRSNGVNGSDGVNGSYGVLNCFGVDREIFNANKTRTHKIFGKEVTEDRWNDVWGKLHEKLNGWKPEFNNAFELYIKTGKNWKKVKASEITGTLEDHNQPYEAWKNMPQEAIDYVKSLPEFNAEIFEAVTGIKQDDKKRELLNKADELIKKAEELKEQANKL